MAAVSSELKKGLAWRDGGSGGVEREASDVEFRVRGSKYGVACPLRWGGVGGGVVPLGSQPWGGDGRGVKRWDQGA